MLRLIVICLVASHARAFFLGFDTSKMLNFTMGEKKTTTQTPVTEAVSNCCHLTGLWVNDHGSVLSLEHREDGSLQGEFLSAVETRLGASGGVQMVSGRAGKSLPTTFGMIVTFKDGQSTTAWSGQYHKCNGKETLFTTWILTSNTKSCQDHWMSSRVGQDKFTRKLNVKRDRLFKSLKRNRYFAKLQKRG